MAERLDIVITEQGARVVRRNIQDVGRAAGGTASQVDLLKRALALLGGAVIIRQLVNFADSFTQLQNQIRVAAGETANLSQVTDRLLRISNDTRTSIEANVQLFQRLSFAAGELGATQEELFRFVETTGRALAIQGGSAEAASGALLQLSQAIGSGIVRAEEFNSILEGAFPIALAVADGLDAAGGSVAKLRQLIIQGKVTSDEFFNALLSQQDELQEAFERTTPTIGQAFTVLRNNLIAFIGEADQARGITAFFARAIISLAENLDTLAAVLTPVAVGFAAAFSPAIISAILGTGRALAGLLVTLGPIGGTIFAVSAGLTALALAIEDVTGGVFEANGTLVTFSDVVTATFNVSGRLVERLDAELVPAFRAVGVEVEGLRDVFSSVFNFAVDVVDRIIGLFQGLGGAVGRAIGLLLEGTFDLSSVLQTFQEGLDARPIREFITAVEEEAVAVARAREEQEALNEVVEESNSNRERSVELTKQQATALDRLLNSVNLVRDAEQRLAEARELLNAGVQTGTISTEQAADAWARLRREIVGVGNAQDEYVQRLELLKAALADGAISQQEFAQAQRDIRLAFLDTQTDAFSGFERGLIRLEAQMTDFATQTEIALGNAFRGAQDAIVDFAVTGKASFSDLRDQIIRDLIRIGIQAAITAALGGGPAGGGASAGAGAAIAGLFGAQGGADFTVNKASSVASVTGAGLDNRLVAFTAKDGERVRVTRQGEAPGGSGGRAGPTVVQNITTPDADSFRRSQQQNLARGAAALQRSDFRNN